jgi:hypothetical protein
MHFMALRHHPRTVVNGVAERPLLEHTRAIIGHLDQLALRHRRWPIVHKPPLLPSRPGSFRLDGIRIRSCLEWCSHEVAFVADRRYRNDCMIKSPLFPYSTTPASASFAAGYSANGINSARDHAGCPSNFMSVKGSA